MDTTLIVTRFLFGALALVMFGLGPAYTFLIESRLPFGFMRKGPMPWVSTMTTNAGIALAAGVLILCMGFTTFIIVQDRKSTRLNSSHH